MGAHAALVALERAGLVGSELGAIVFATASSPYVVKSAAAVVADYVGAPASAWVTDLGAGTHAGRARAGAGAAPGRDHRARPDPRGRRRCARPATRATFPISPSAPGPSPSSSDGADGSFLEDASFRYSSYSNDVAGGRAALRPALRRRAVRSLRGRRGASRGGSASSSSNEPVRPRLVGAAARRRRRPTRMAKACDVPIDRRRRRRPRPSAKATPAAPTPLATSSSRSTVLDAGERVVVHGFGAGAGTVAPCCGWSPTVGARPAPAGSPRPVELPYVQFLRHRGHLTGPRDPVGRLRLRGLTGVGAHEVVLGRAAGPAMR